MKVNIGKKLIFQWDFGIFGGFRWVRSSVLVGELGFGRIRSSTSRVRSSSKIKHFSEMFNVVGLWVQSSGFLEGSSGFIVQFWLAILGLKGFKD